MVLELAPRTGWRAVTESVVLEAGHGLVTAVTAPYLLPTNGNSGRKPRYEIMVGTTTCIAIFAQLLLASGFGGVMNAADSRQTIFAHHFESKLNLLSE